jgi:gentisate 1,2-dioxygenase
MAVLSRSALARELAGHHLAVHQPDDPPLLTPEPSTSVRPYLWRWATLEPLLSQVSEAVPLDPGGNRRTLRLVNPGLPSGTTHTLWAGLQQVLPGEVATAHRHTPTAFRFIIQGQGASTTINGERYRMEPGDVVLTPNWCWHDHQNDGTETALWLDGLDLPLVRALNAMFFEPFPQDRQPVLEPPDSAARRIAAPGLVPSRSSTPFLPIYKWERTLDALHALAATDPDPFDDVILEYRNPVSGGPALQTIGLAIQLLRPGARTRAHRHSSSTLYHVVHGQGITVIDGAAFAWTARDFLVVPPWAWHEHANASTIGEAILFQMNDVPAMRALGFYREQER